MRDAAHFLFLVFGSFSIVYGVAQYSAPAAWIAGGALAVLAGLPYGRKPRKG